VGAIAPTVRALSALTDSQGEGPSLSNMDYSVIRPGSWYKVGTVIIKHPPESDRGMTTQRSYSDCHVLLADGWCYIEVVEPHGEGSVNAYPADQIAAVVNLYDDSPAPAIF
jgi:hypothetical protein